MVEPKALRRQLTKMGQTSSQLGPPALEKAPTTAPKKTRKWKKSSSSGKGKSVENEEPSINQEQESARVLMQLKQGGFQESSAPHHHKDKGPAQPPANDPSLQHFRSLDETATRALRGLDDHLQLSSRKNKRRKPGQDYDITDGNELQDAEKHYRKLQSAAPRLHENDILGAPAEILTQPTQNLDDIPTDDEDLASLIQEYQHETPELHESQLPLGDLYPFSQQPSDVLSPSLPPYKAEKLAQNDHGPIDSGDKQRKKRKKGADLDFDGIAGDTRLNGNDEDQELPIDPELHSIRTLQPSADLSHLDDDPMQQLDQDQTSLQDDNTSHPQRKRRRANKSLVPELDEQIYESPYDVHRENEILKDQLAPKLEDIRDHTTDHADGHLSDPALSSPKFRRSKLTREALEELNGQDTKVSKRNTNPTPETGGVFTGTEILRLESFRESYCNANDMTFPQFNQLIQSTIRGNAQVIGIFNEIYDLVPYRNHGSVQKFCRRRFHNYAVRGVWAADDDDMLRQAIVEKGTSWKIVGEMIDRFPEDCRDRYRNYLKNGENRNREQWTEEEIFNLCAAILDCIELMKDEQRKTTGAKNGPNAPEPEPESDEDNKDLKLINWQSVSDRMGSAGGGRSRLQCSFKWGKLKEQDRRKYMDQIRNAQGDFGVARITKNQNKNSAGWRARRAVKRVANMRSGDRYDLLQAIQASGVPTEGNIPWKTLGDEILQSRWSTAERKAAWDMLKQEVPNHDSIDYRDIVFQLMDPLLAHGVDDRWDSAVHGYVEDYDKETRAIARKDREKKKKRQARADAARLRNEERDRERGIKSNALVSDSDDAQEISPWQERREEQSHIDAGYNDFDPLLAPRKPNQNSRSSNPEAPSTDDGRGENFRNEFYGGSHVDGLHDSRGPRDAISSELGYKVQMLQHA